MTPWGDLWFAEDETIDGGDGKNRIVGITPGGETYVFARNAKSDSEFAGPTFAPDGKTFFVNTQTDGLTFAIWGPFARRSRTRQRTMAVAAPPAQSGASGIRRARRSGQEVRHEPARGRRLRPARGFDSLIRTQNEQGGRV